MAEMDIEYAEPVDIRIPKQTEELTKEWFQQVVQSKEGNDVSVIEFAVFPPDANTEGYLSNIHEMSCELEYPDGKTKSMHLVVKLNALQDWFNKFALFTRSYKKEVWFYTEMVPQLELFIKEKSSVPIELPFAKCYYAAMKDDQSIVMLDNLKHQGYETWKERLHGLPTEYVHKAWGEIAKFHSISMAYQLKTRIDYDDWCYPEHDFVASAKRIAKGQSQVEKSIDACYKASAKFFMGIVADRDGDDSPKIQMIRDVFSSTTDHYEKACHKTKLTTLTQGDFQPQNIFFKKDKDGLKVKLIDFQIVRNTSPVLDLLFCAFAGASRTTRRVCTNDFLKTYYQSFKTCLEAFGLSEEGTGITFADLCEDYHDREAMLYGFIIGNIILQNASTPNPPDYTTKPVSFENLLEYKRKHLSAQFQDVFYEAINELEELIHGKA